MKNIHLLPTDKPSRLYLGDNGNFVFGMMQTSVRSKNDSFTNQHIYITSDNADINENDYIITKDGRLVEVSYLLSKDLEGASKIILTTDELYIHNDLIPKEYNLFPQYIQKIDDEFLEWFIKNPSCESVEVTFNNRGITGAEKILKTFGEYKIIITEEEPKQEPFKHKVEVLSKEEIIANRSNAYEFIDFDKQETLELEKTPLQQLDEKGNPLTFWGGLAEPKQDRTCTNNCSVVCGECQIFKPKQETTLEEAKAKLFRYSEEEVLDILYKHTEDMLAGNKVTLEEWFNKIKKK